MIVLIIMAVIAFVDFLVLWIPCYMDHAYDDEPVEVSNNKDFNFFFTWFLIPHAQLYDRMEGRINKCGIGILLTGLSLLTLPATIFMTAIGGLALFCTSGWRKFCEVFAEEK